MTWPWRRIASPKKSSELCIRGRRHTRCRRSAPFALLTDRFPLAPRPSILHPTQRRRQTKGIVHPLSTGETAFCRPYRCEQSKQTILQVSRKLYIPTWQALTNKAAVAAAPPAALPIKSPFMGILSRTLTSQIFLPVTLRRRPISKTANYITTNGFNNVGPGRGIKSDASV